MKAILILLSILQISSAYGWSPSYQTKDEKEKSIEIMKDYSTHAFHGLIVSGEPVKARKDPYTIEGTKIYITEDIFRYKVRVIEEFKGELGDEEVFILNRKLPVGEQFTFWVTGPTNFWLTIHHYEPHTLEAEIQIKSE
tara:strand:- start:109 stop:525 length:417 start_codon:yes stop_codon:yes gene_type:complete